MPKEKDHWETINCCEQHANEHGVLSQIKVNNGYLYKLRAAGVVSICFGQDLLSVKPPSKAQSGWKDDGTGHGVSRGASPLKKKTKCKAKKKGKNK